MVSSAANILVSSRGPSLVRVSIRSTRAVPMRRSPVVIQNTVSVPHAAVTNPASSSPDDDAHVLDGATGHVAAHDLLGADCRPRGAASPGTGRTSVSTVGLTAASR